MISRPASVRERDIRQRDCPGLATTPSTRGRIGVDGFAVMFKTGQRAQGEAIAGIDDERTAVALVDKFVQAVSFADHPCSPGSCLSRIIPVLRAPGNECGAGEAAVLLAAGRFRRLIIGKRVQHVTQSHRAGVLPACLWSDGRFRTTGLRRIGCSPIQFGV